MKNILKKILFIILLLLGSNNLAYAHAKITYVYPVHKSTIATTTDVSINFNRKLRLTKVILIKDGKQILKFAVEEKFGKKFTYKVNQKLETGRYSVRWWGIALDGHTMRGAWRFTIEK